MLSSCHFVSVEADLQKPVDCSLEGGARVGSMEIQILMTPYPKLKRILLCRYPWCASIPGPYQIRLNEWRAFMVSLRLQTHEVRIDDIKLAEP